MIRLELPSNDPAEAYRKGARRMVRHPFDFHVSHNAIVTRDAPVQGYSEEDEENGRWVAVWVYVPNEEAK